MSFWNIYFSSLCGAALDFFTTTIGLNLGFVEGNLNYHPVWAFLFYTSAIVIFHLTLSEKIRKVGFAILVLLSFVAAVSNALVIFGFSCGIPL
jgi:hypothetical protein